MKNLIVYTLISATALNCISKKEKMDDPSILKTGSFQPHVEMLDSKLEDIVDPTSKVEIIAEGFDWSEGPLWIEGLGLLFSDIPPNRIYLWTAEHGVNLYLTPSGYTGSSSRGGEVGSNGLVLDEHGNLVLCQHGDRRIAKMKVTLHDPKPEYTTIVDNYKGKKLNSPNDACFNQAGDLYFTDPPYGLEKNVDDPLKEIPFQGVYKYSRSGDLMLLTDEMTRPNGIAFSPDEKTLYVANSDPKQAHWMSYQLNEEGMIESKQILYDATTFVGKEAGLPDGLKVDTSGNIFATGPGGIWIFDSHGKVLGKIKTGQATSNCAIGNDGKVLYITADMFVMKVKLKADK
jgi:gluconolactonase